MYRPKRADQRVRVWQCVQAFLNVGIAQLS